MEEFQFTRPLRLGVNIDHVATLRQARYAKLADSPNAEPDVIAAASACERGGAHSITIHLRADRRHIQDRDVFRLRESVMTKLNLELANQKEIVEIALKVLPEDACIVPENRQEITTEGGLDVVAHRKQLEPTIKRLQNAGIHVSLFIDPVGEQIAAAAELGAEYVELHTGAFSNATGEDREAELDRLKSAAKFAAKHRLKVNAGHGINYTNIKQILQMPHLIELNIGHSIVSRAVIIGLENAVRDMLEAMSGYEG